MSYGSCGPLQAFWIARGSLEHGWECSPLVPCSGPEGQLSPQLRTRAANFAWWGRGELGEEEERPGVAGDCDQRN